VINEIIEPGTVVVIKKEAMTEDFSSTERLFRCEGGFGMNPANIGNKIFGTWLDDNTKDMIRRSFISWTETEEYHQRKKEAPVEA
jgi:hypothetical protein